MTPVAGNRFRNFGACFRFLSELREVRMEGMLGGGCSRNSNKIVFQPDVPIAKLLLQESVAPKVLLQGYD